MDSTQNKVLVSDGAHKPADRRFVDTPNAVLSSENNLEAPLASNGADAYQTIGQMTHGKNDSELQESPTITPAPRSKFIGMGKK